MCKHELLDYLDTPELALTWLYSAAKNRLLDILKEKRPDLLPENFDAGADDDGIATFEAEDFYQRIMESLPPNIRPIYELLCQGFEKKEAAEILGRKLNTVHVQCERATEKLRRKLSLEK